MHSQAVGAGETDHGMSSRAGSTPIFMPSISRRQWIVCSSDVRQTSSTFDRPVFLPVVKQVSFAWEPPIIDGGTPIFEYEISYSVKEVVKKDKFSKQEVIITPAEPVFTSRSAPTSIPSPCVRKCRANLNGLQPVFIFFLSLILPMFLLRSGSVEACGTAFLGCFLVGRSYSCIVR